MRKPVGVLGSMAAAALTLTASTGPALAAGHGPQGSHAAGRAMSLAWKIVPSPNGHFHSNELSSVSCPSASACIAVGNAARPLAERWNGAKWTTLATPRLPGQLALNGVSCLSARDCTAVGGQGTQTLAESWNGTRWTVVPTPSAASGFSTLYGVSCVSARACTAVGFVVTGAHFDLIKPLIETWNGTAWTIVPRPELPPSSYSGLSSVSCISARDCTAVGVRDDGNKPLIETWNGTAWKVVPSPTGPNALGDLDGVTCLSATACTAVGYVFGPTRSTTLIESWNGTGWKVVPSPNEGPASASNILDSISCVSARDCTAVGSFSYALGRHKTLIETWTGIAWKVVPSPNGAADNGLSGVSCAAAVTCSAVGSYGLGPTRKTLAELGTPAS